MASSIPRSILQPNSQIQWNSSFLSNSSSLFDSYNTNPTSQSAPNSPITSNDDIKITPTLEEILSEQSSCPYSKFEFANFLKKTFCYENLKFLMELENFINLLNNNNQENLNYLKVFWLNLSNDFIKVNSENEINLSATRRKQLLSTFDNNNKIKLDCYSIKACLYTDPNSSLNIPSKKLLSETIIDIKELLRDAYLGFLTSVENNEDNINYIGEYENNYDNFTNSVKNGNYIDYWDSNYCLSNSNNNKVNNNTFQSYDDSNLSPLDTICVLNIQNTSPTITTTTTTTTTNNNNNKTKKKTITPSKQTSNNTNPNPRSLNSNSALILRITYQQQLEIASIISDGSKVRSKSSKPSKLSKAKRGSVSSVSGRRNSNFKPEDASKLPNHLPSSTYIQRTAKHRKSLMSFKINMNNDTTNSSNNNSQSQPQNNLESWKEKLLKWRRPSAIKAKGLAR
ncbi:uncharacterized protein ASCRUDRAFT_82817 [Ascoidea rubescens DSM 1968]|uniref:RGS domain-containing protein n=1 Tax=Ascoidea rubescens DSM 1968 TaxID=1344418 RepID=A0A1D2VAH7_9ASCO|nr:hypothetical protein ASCRUDRAFT_82817 [Ascoidea rubescens DSM 1968]ODV58457.1 hypothetical protein ASCRUDRAFT_82817 [Ascoidea rubescens DSM 1968]